MRAVVQRVLEAQVEVGGKEMSAIGRGLCVLIGITHDDTPADADYIVRKLLQLRVFEDEKGKQWARAAPQLQLPLLVVSQFTLYARLKGNKPDYHLARGSDEARVSFNAIIAQLRKEYQADKILEGCFGEHMHVKLVNDGPVTIILDSNSREPVLKPKSEAESKPTADGQASGAAAASSTASSTSDAAATKEDKAQG